MQVSKELEEQELLQTFRQFGRILSHTWRRGTNCAYIDYEDSLSATQAKRAMDGTVMYGAALRVEFKVSLKYTSEFMWQFVVLCSRSCPGSNQ